MELSASISSFVYVFRAANNTSVVSVQSSEVW